MFVRTLLACLFIASPALAQDGEPASEDAAPADPLRNLQIIDERVQTEALDELDGEQDAEPVRGLSDVQAIFERAQIAYATEEYETAYIHARTAAVAGHAQAATLAGLMHENQQIAEANVADAIRWYRRASEQDEPLAHYRLGRLAELGSGGLQPAQARAYFMQGAQLGHLDSMLAYALALKASAVPQEAAQALEWAERVATQAHPEAMYQLAQMYDVWERGPNDPEAARVWYVRAAEAGHAEALLQAGLMLAAGEGGLADPDLAIDYLRRSAEAGFGPAMGQYGLMLYQGWNGAEPDLESAAEWFAQGALAGDAESQFLYAYASAAGEGVEQDLVRAYFWVLMAELEADGTRVENTDRDRLQAQLENVLTPTEAEQIRSEIARYRAR